MPKNPQRPTRALTLEAGDAFNFQEPLFRLHRTKGKYALPWDQLRRFGPLKSSRWDPHPEPPQEHESQGVSYAAVEPITCFAEVFQARRSISVSTEHSLTAWIPIRVLRLLDLTEDWALRQGASASLHAASVTTCRQWAQAIDTQLGNSIDGLYVPSTMTGRPNVVLFSRSADAFPSAPEFTRPLTHPGLKPMILHAAHSLRWPVRF